MEKRLKSSIETEALNLVSTLAFEERLVEASFLSRPTRFSAFVKLDGKTLLCFVPNPGRMRGLLKPGARAILRELDKRGRKTRFDLIGVFHMSQRISVDSRVPNKLVLVALRNGDIVELTDYTEIKPEYGYNHTRFDFFLTGNSKPCLLEVKSCTLVKDG